MVKEKLEYGKMSCFDSSLGNFSSLVINGSKAIIEKYVELKNRKLASNERIILTDREFTIIENAKKCIMSLVEKSINLLYENDYSLIFAKQSERGVCARLAFILQNALKLNNITNYFVDVEYVLFKKKHSSRDNEKSTNEDKGKGYCDLVIHSRGKNKYANFLLAIEMKVHNNNNMESDIDRLKKLTTPWPIPYDNNRACDSLLGLFLIIQKTQYQYKKVHRREDHSEPAEENWITKKGGPKESYIKLKNEIKK